MYVRKNVFHKYILLNLVKFTLTGSDQLVKRIIIYQ